MHRFQMQALTAMAAWALGAAAMNAPIARDYLSGICPRGSQDVEAFAATLSKSSQIYFPGSEEFVNASTRWSVLGAPTVSVVIVPGTEKDVVETVKFANKFDIPFLAFNGVHGATTTLGKMTHGIEIYLEQLSSVKVSKDGKTATIGGGTNAKVVTDSLWAAGKQTVTGTCECVSYMGPALGGGHGWLQGRHGLAADQWVSMNVVLADGTLRTIDNDDELMWAMKGAGHNFGIVTSVTTKIFDIQHRDWAIETFIFSGSQVEEVYQVANDKLIKNGTQDVDVIHWSYWLNIPDFDTEKPVIMFYLIQEGVTSIDPVHSQPLRDIGPLNVAPVSGSYGDLAGWTGIALDSPPCQKEGLVNPRFPIYLENFDLPAMTEAYDIYAAGVAGSSPFNNSLLMFESYSNAGVRAVDHKSTAFAFRTENILAAPLITYTPGGAERDEQAAELGDQLRDILHLASGRSVYRAYVNYSYGNENQKELYGSESWRQCKLKALKMKYDPEEKFSFYAPVKA